MKREKVERRVNQKLEAEGKALRRTPPSDWQGLEDRGEYYIVALALDTVTKSHIDLTELAHELGVLDEGEGIDLI